MIMMGDKKKMVTSILGPMSDNVGKKGEDGYPKEDGEDSLLVCMEELMDCLHAKDAAGAAEAFKAAFEHLSMGPAEESAE